MKKCQNLLIFKYLLRKISFYLIIFNGSSGTRNNSFVKNVFFFTSTVVYEHSSNCISSVKWNWGLKTVVWYKNIIPLPRFIQLFKENIKTEFYIGLWKLRSNIGKRIEYVKKKNAAVRRFMFVALQSLLNRLSILNRWKMGLCWLTRKIAQSWL